MREEGKLVLLVNYRSSPSTISGESITIPGSGAYYGDYTAKLNELPRETDGVTISGFTEVDSLPVSANEFYVNYNNGLITFHSSDATESVSAGYKGLGSIIDAADLNTLQITQNIALFHPGKPVITDDEDYSFVIPLGAFESDSGFGSSGVNQIEVQGVSVQAISYEYATGDTTFVVSDGKKGAGGDAISVTLGSSDRRSSTQGSVVVDPETEAIYGYWTASGGHFDILIHVWFRRAST